MSDEPMFSLKVSAFGSEKTVTLPRRMSVVEVKTAVLKNFPGSPDPSGCYLKLETGGILQSEDKPFYRSNPQIFDSVSRNEVVLITIIKKEKEKDKDKDKDKEKEKNVNRAGSVRSRVGQTKYPAAPAPKFPPNPPPSSPNGQKPMNGTPNPTPTIRGSIVSVPMDTRRPLSMGSSRAAGPAGNGANGTVRPKRDQDVNPLMVILQSGKLLMSVGDLTIEELIRLVQAKITHMVESDLCLTLEDGTIIEPSPEKFFDIALINSKLVSNSIPTIYCSATLKSPLLQPHNSLHVNPNFYQTYLEKQTGKFTVQFLLPNSQTVTIDSDFSETLMSVKKRLIENMQREKGVDLTNMMKYKVKVPGASEFFLDDNTTIGQHTFLTQLKKRGMRPQLILAEKNSEKDKKQKKLSLQIGNLIGVPLCWTAEQDEITTFRQNMCRFRYELRNRKKLGLVKTPLPISRILPPKTCSNSWDRMVQVTVESRGTQVNKTIKVNDDETAHQLLVKLFKKCYEREQPNRSAGEYILKISGVKEYIDGNEPFTNFEYVRNCISKGHKVKLVMVDRPKDDSLDDEEEEEFNEEVLQQLTHELSYNHESLNLENQPWDKLTCFSIWSMPFPFRIKIFGVEDVSPYSASFQELQPPGTRTDIEDAPISLYVTCGIYHGGELIGNLMTTNLTECSAHPRWNQWLISTTKLCNLPRGARVCFTVWGRPSKKEATEKVAFGWVNCRLFDYKHELVTGTKRLNMWPDGEANPIGTCVPNQKPGCPVLFVEFDTYPLPVVFPTEAMNLPSEFGNEPLPNVSQKAEVDLLISKDPLYVLQTHEKELLWAFRGYCRMKPESLPKFLVSVPYDDHVSVEYAHKVLTEWPKLRPVDALELLDAKFGDAKVRDFAVDCLREGLKDFELLDYLLQLVQVIKYEPYHDNSLSRFLLERALINPTVGHNFFWYLKSEMHVPEISERYGLLLEAYLRGCGRFKEELSKQDDILKKFVTTANTIKLHKDSDRRPVMEKELRKIQFPDKFPLPLNPSWQAKGLRIESCRYMDSKKLPLWLVFENADSLGSSLVVLFKSGDDLRQDMLTLQMIKIMDKLWKNEDLDLELSPYAAISTGDEVGMLEVVLNSETTASISRNAGGAAAAFREDPLANWLAQHNPEPAAYKKAVEYFIKSCAGYCVATFVLGIGDRHNDNIMMTRAGRLFHIDFGHFLGNFKSKFGIKRERAPFVLTPDFAFVMGGKNSEDFQKFTELCCRAYNILRKHANMFINLFAMMLSTGIPELTRKEDIDYLRDAFSLDLDDTQAAKKFRDLIEESLATKTTQINNAIHIWAHS